MRLSRLMFLMLALSSAVSAQSIEGYWQDVAGRSLSMRGAPADSVFGGWGARDLDQTYPQAKQIRKDGSSFDLMDLNYDDEYIVKVVSAKEDRIIFVRSARWSQCGMHHACRLEGEGLLCSMRNLCREGGQVVLQWEGEERYVRRTHCSRVGRTEAQGIPVKCN